MIEDGSTRVQLPSSITVSAAALVRGTNAGQFDKVKLLHRGGAPHPVLRPAGTITLAGPTPSYGASRQTILPTR